MTEHLAISDLHFGDGGPRDDWDGARVEALEVACIDWVDWKRDHPNGEVFILGDLFNGEYGIEACLAAESTRRCLLALLPLDPRIRPGNHDEGFWRVHKTDPLLRRFRAGDDAILDGLWWLHGHQFDLACGRLGWLGRAASKVAGLVGLIRPAWEDSLRSIGGRNADHAAFERTVLRALAHKNRERAKLGLPALRGVVCGHTHQTQKSGPPYWNTGYREWLRVQA